MQTCGNTTSTKLNHKVRQHAEILAATAATEYKFMMVRPSVMAAAALSAASRGLSTHFTLPHQLTKYQTQIEVVVNHLEGLLQAYSDQHLGGQQSVSCVQAVQQSKHHQLTQREGTLSPTDTHQVAALVA